MSYVDTVVWPDQAAKVAFLTTLKDVCEGKMYVEAESARLHLFLAKIHETNGDIGAACDMIQDVHVETFGSLSKKVGSYPTLFFTSCFCSFIHSFIYLFIYLFIYSFIYLFIYLFIY